MEWDSTFTPNNNNTTHILTNKHFLYLSFEIGFLYSTLYLSDNKTTQIFMNVGIFTAEKFVCKHILFVRKKCKNCM